MATLLSPLKASRIIRFVPLPRKEKDYKIFAN